MTHHDDPDAEEDEGLVATAWDEEDLPFDPAAFGDLADEIDAFPMDGCVITRGGREFYPFKGQRFWVHPIVPAKLSNAFMAFAGGAQDEKPGGMAAPFEALCEGLSRCVVGWDLVDPVTGEGYAAPYRNAAVFQELATEAMYFILSTVARGETPDARPNASTPRRGGSGTRRSSGQRIHSTSAAPRRR